MFKKSASILLAATVLAGTAITTAMAQPDNYALGYPQPTYENGYRDGYQRGYDDGRNGSRYDDRAYNQPSPRAFDDADQRWRREYQRQYSYKDDVYYRECRNRTDPGGVIAGAIIGGILGNAIGRGGGRTGTTIAGVVLGGALGAALTRNLDCEDQSYAYNTYYDGFNGGRVGVPYQWRNPRTGHYGELRIDDYYNDRAGFRCANFTQRIWINNRPQAANGRACQQPDGTWAVVR